MQSLSIDKSNAIKEMTMPSRTIEYLNLLDVQVQDLNKMLKVHDDFKVEQKVLLSRYTNMIDIGIQKKPRLDQCENTSLSLMDQVPFDLKDIV